jgi:hypothetical protein
MLSTAYSERNVTKVQYQLCKANQGAWFPDVGTAHVVVPIVIVEGQLPPDETPVTALP